MPTTIDMPILQGGFHKVYLCMKSYKKLMAAERRENEPSPGPCPLIAYPTPSSQS